MNAIQIIVDDKTELETSSNNIDNINIATF